jgi:hypothetical protein
MRVVRHGFNLLGPVGIESARRVPPHGFGECDNGLLSHAPALRARWLPHDLAHPERHSVGVTRLLRSCVSMQGRRCGGAISLPV